MTPPGSLGLRRRRPRGALYIKHIPVFEQVAWFDLRETNKKSGKMVRLAAEEVSKTTKKRDDCDWRRG